MFRKESQTPADRTAIPPTRRFQKGQTDMVNRLLVNWQSLPTG